MSYRLCNACGYFKCPPSFCLRHPSHPLLPVPMDIEAEIDGQSGGEVVGAAAAQVADDGNVGTGGVVEGDDDDDDDDDDGDDGDDDDDDDDDEGD